MLHDWQEMIAVVQAASARSREAPDGADTDTKPADEVATPESISNLEPPAAAAATTALGADPFAASS